MADTQRTKLALLALMADNVTGQVSCQDFRDFMITVMDLEFVNPGDFFARPQAKYTLTDKTARGWKEYSQYVGSACSFMNIMFQEASTGYWMKADVAASGKTGRLGIAMDSYASDVSTATILIEGMIYNSDFSTIFSELLGRPIYLDSGVPGSVSIGQTANSEIVVGFICNSDDHGGSAIGKWYFLGKACWAVRGQ